MDDKLEVDFSTQSYTAKLWGRTFSGDLKQAEQGLSAHGLALHDDLPYLLPVAVRWLSPDCEVAVLEHPPRVQPMYFSPRSLSEAMQRQDHTRYDIALPWQVYILDLVSGVVFMFGRTAPLSDQDDSLLHVSLPNLAPTGVFCQHHDYTRWVSNEPRSVSQKIRYLMVDLWGSGFNLNMVFDPHIPPELKPNTVADRGDIFGRSNWASILTRWEAASCQEVLRWQWPNAEQGSLRSTLQYVRGFLGDELGENLGILKSIQQVCIRTTQNQQATERHKTRKVAQDPPRRAL